MSWGCAVCTSEGSHDGQPRVAPPPSYNTHLDLGLMGQWQLQLRSAWPSLLKRPQPLVHLPSINRGVRPTETFRLLPRLQQGSLLSQRRIIAETDKFSSVDKKTWEKSDSMQIIRERTLNEYLSESVLLS